MKKTILSLIALTLHFAVRPLAAQISPTVSVQGTNATLRWASTPGESYVVLYRRAFHPEFNWTVIGTNVPAGGGIETFFQHTGGVPRVPASVGGGGGGGGSSPPVLQSATAPTTDSTQDKDDKVKAKDSELPAFPSLPDEKEIEKWLKEMLKEYERQQREGGGVPAFSALMASTLTAEQATSNSMGFYKVLQTGVQIRNLSSAAKLSGTTNILVEIGLPDAAETTVMLLVNGQPGWGAPMITPKLPIPFVEIPFDTRTLSNGFYTLSVVVEASLSPGGVLQEISSPGYGVLITNGLFYPDWMSSFGETGDGLWVNAYLTATNVNWTANFYDGSSNFVGSTLGYSTDGTINFVWNLNGTNGAVLTDNEFTVVLQAWQTVLAAPGTPPFGATATPPKLVRTARRSGQGAWIIAYLEELTTFTDGLLVPDTMDRFAAAAYASNFTTLPVQVAADTAFQLSKDNPDADANWTAFKSTITEPAARNLVYLGHGAADLIGYAAQPVRSYRAFQIARDLGITPATANRNPYRFVFLDGCNTANGKLCEAFGIKQKENMTTAEFINAKERPKAFVGWTKVKAIASATAINKRHIDFLNEFIRLWKQDNIGLRDAFNQAAQVAGPGNIGYDTLKIYGYPALRFGEFNGPSIHP